MWCVFVSLDSISVNVVPLYIGCVSAWLSHVFFTCHSIFFSYVCNCLLWVWLIFVFLSLHCVRFLAFYLWHHVMLLTLKKDNTTVASIYVVYCLFLAWSLNLAWYVLVYIYIQLLYIQMVQQYICVHVSISQYMCDILMALCVATVVNIYMCILQSYRQILCYCSCLIISTTLQISLKATLWLAWLILNVYSPLFVWNVVRINR